MPDVRSVLEGLLGPGVPPQMATVRAVAQRAECTIDDARGALLSYTLEFLCSRPELAAFVAVAKEGAAGAPIGIDVRRIPLDQITDRTIVFAVGPAEAPVRSAIAASSAVMYQSILPTSTEPTQSPPKVEEEPAAKRLAPEPSTAPSATISKAPMAAPPVKPSKGAKQASLLSFFKPAAPKNTPN
jgi:hypothetical protein